MLNFKNIDKSKIKNIVFSFKYSVIYVALQCVFIMFMFLLFSLFNKGNIESYYSMLSLVATICAGLPLIIKILYEQRKNKNIYNKIKIKDIGIIIVISTISYLLVGILLTLLTKILPSNIMDNYNELINGINDNSPFILLLIAVGIIGPISEEIVFRYGIQSKIATDYPIGAIFIQAIAFGVMHGNIVQGTYAFLLGIILGFIYKKYNYNLLATTIFHIFFNCITVFATFLITIV